MDRKFWENRKQWTKNFFGIVLGPIFIKYLRKRIGEGMNDINKGLCKHYIKYF